MKERGGQLESKSAQVANAVDGQQARRQGRLSAIVGSLTYVAGFGTFVGGLIDHYNTGVMDGGLIAMTAGLTLRIVGMLRASKPSQ